MTEWQTDGARSRTLSLSIRCANVKHLMFQFYGFGSCGQTLLFIVFVHKFYSPYLTVCCTYVWLHAVDEILSNVCHLYVCFGFIWKWNFIPNLFAHSPRIPLTYSRDTSSIFISERWINGPFNLVFLFSHFHFEYWDADDVNWQRSFSFTFTLLKIITFSPLSFSVTMSLTGIRNSITLHGRWAVCRSLSSKFITMELTHVAVIKSVVYFFFHLFIHIQFIQIIFELCYHWTKINWKCKYVNTPKLQLNYAHEHRPWRRNIRWPYSRGPLQTRRYR